MRPTSLMRPTSTAPQLDLFSGPAQNAPAPTFHEHETSIVHGHTVRVRLRLTGNHLDAPLPEGPLTFAECQQWDEPCALKQCRYRLDDDMERRTRRVREDEDRYGNALHSDEDDPRPVVQGPRFPNGGFYRDSEMGPGDWCALRVAADYSDHGAPLSKLADLYGMTKEGVSKWVVTPALEAAGIADHELDDVFEGHYGDAGRIHKFKFEPADDNLTSTEVDKCVVPGEEPCACQKCACADAYVARGEVHAECGLRVKAPGKVCGTCGLRVKRGRQAPTIRRMSRKDRWEGVTSVVVPETLLCKVDEHGRTVREVGKVDPRLMKPLGRTDVIPPKFADMAEMLRARASAAEKRKAGQE